MKKLSEALKSLNTEKHQKPENTRKANTNFQVKPVPKIRGFNVSAKACRACKCN